MNIYRIVANRQLTEYSGSDKYINISSIDILNDVFRKFQVLVKKWDTSKEVLDIKKELLSLVKKECKLAEPSPENRQKNLGLSRSEFKNLCTLLKQGDEKLIEKVYLAHFKQCKNYLIFKEAAGPEEAHNCSMDALYEIRKGNF